MSNLSLAERQPVAVRAAIVTAVTAVVHILVVTGLVSADLEDPIAAAVDAIGLVVLTVWTISAVTPTAKVIAQVTTEGEVVTGGAAVDDAGTRVHLDDNLGDLQVKVEPVAVKAHLLGSVD